MATAGSAGGLSSLKSFADLGRALTLTNICRLFALLLVAWQPFPGEYRVPLVGSALLGLTLTWRGEWRAVAEPAKRLGLLLLCLLIPGLLSIPTSLAPSKSWGEIASVVLVGLAGLSVLYGLRRQQDHRWLQTGLVIVIAAWIGDGLLQALTGADVFGIVPPDGFITGPFRPNAIFGIILSILLPLVFWGPLKKREWWAPFLLCGTLVVIVLTGQRNNLLLAAIGLACISNLWSKRTRLVAASLFAATLIVTYPLSPALQERGSIMIDTLLRQPTSPKTIENKSSALDDADNTLAKLNALSSNRGYIFEAGINMIKAQPVFGIGASAFRKAYPKFTSEKPAQQNFHAHHIYLGITAETGLIGLSSFLFAIVLASKWFLTSTPDRRSSAIPYAYTLIVMLFPLATHTSLYRAFHFSIFLMVLCGFLSALYSPSIGECLNIDKEKDLASSEP